MASLKKSKTVDFPRIALRKPGILFTRTVSSYRFGQELVCDYSEGHNGFNDKNDLITPLADKLYGEKMKERSCLTSGFGRGDPNLLDINLRGRELVNDARRWSVSKVLVSIFMVLSLADVMIRMVDVQMESRESHQHGDRPRSSMGLGSAAISSITFTLSPILPFTGGIDLRREDYWVDGFFGSLCSVVEKVRVAFDESPTNIFSKSLRDENDYDPAIRDVLNMPRGGAAVAAKSRTRNKPKNKNKTSSSKHGHVLSSADCFVPIKQIADMTLKDLTVSLRYTLESTKKDFNQGKFMSGLSPRLKNIIDRVAKATSIARGSDLRAPITGEPKSAKSTGDIDAINFCASMRLFAEWRVLRQVPPGYKGYAVGVGLAQKDMVQNIAKVEDAIQNYIDLQKRNDDDNTQLRNNEIVTSPTLRDLLKYEVDTNLHDNTKLPRLQEKSAAMGVLWLQRQLIYQTALFTNTLDVPKRYDSTGVAVQAAYDKVYKNFHGWAIRKIFSYSFQAAPEGIEIFKFMNPHRLKEVEQEARAKSMGTLVGKKRKLRQHGKVGKLENTPIGRFSQHVGNEWNKIACNVGNEWEKLSENVGNEWDKVTGTVGQLFGQQKDQRGKEKSSRPKNDCVAMTANLGLAIVSDDDAKQLEMEKYIRQEMRKDAYEHIKVYLEVVDPLVDDLNNLIEEFNMDDPTKV